MTRFLKISWNLMKILAIACDIRNYVESVASHLRLVVDMTSFSEWFQPFAHWVCTAVCLDWRVCVFSPRNCVSVYWQSMHYCIQAVLLVKHKVHSCTGGQVGLTLSHQMTLWSWSLHMPMGIYVGT